jgi:hypothetical protein
VKLVARYEMQFEMASTYHFDTMHDTVALDASLERSLVL